MIDIYAGEAQLARWSETSSGGATITLWLPDGDALAQFKLLTERKGKQSGQILAIVVKQIDDDAQPAQPAPQINKAGKGPYGHWYSCLYPGWFANENVKDVFGVSERNSPEVAVDMIKSDIYDAFNVNSMSEIDPKNFAKFAFDKGLYYTLPTLLRVKESA